METLSRQKKDLEKHNEKSYQRRKKWAIVAMENFEGEPFSTV